MRHARLPFTLEFDFDNRMNAFGALVSEPSGERRIVVNMAAILWVCRDEPEANWKEITADTVLHEVLHAIQDELGKVMTEGEVEASIERARAMTHEEIAAIPESAPEFDAYETTLARAEQAETELAESKRQVSALLGEVERLRQENDRLWHNLSMQAHRIVALNASLSVRDVMSVQRTAPETEER